MLRKYKGTETEFSPVYFNSTAKTVINPKFDLDKSSVKWSDLGQILQLSKKNIKKLKTPGATYDKKKK